MRVCVCVLNKCVNNAIRGNYTNIDLALVLNIFRIRKKVIFIIMLNCDIEMLLDEQKKSPEPSL